MGAASSHLSDDLVAKSKAGGLDRASYEPHASQWSGKAAGSLSASSHSSSDGSMPMMASDSDDDSTNGAAAEAEREAERVRAARSGGGAAATLPLLVAGSVVATKGTARKGAPAEFSWAINLADLGRTTTSDAAPAAASSSTSSAAAAASAAATAALQPSGPHQALASTQPHAAVLIASPPFLVPQPPDRVGAAANPDPAPMTTAWCLLLRINPPAPPTPASQAAAPPAAARAAAPGAPSSTPPAPLASAELLLERVPPPQPRSLPPATAAASVAAAAAAAAACQLVVEVRLPGCQHQGRPGRRGGDDARPPPDQRGGSRTASAAADISGGGSDVRIGLAALDEVFAPPGMAGLLEGGASLQKPVGRLQLPAHLLSAARAAAAAAAAPSNGAATATAGAAGDTGGASLPAEQAGGEVTITAAFHSLDLIPILPHAAHPPAAAAGAIAAATLPPGAVRRPPLDAALLALPPAAAAPPLPSDLAPLSAPPAPLAVHALSAKPRLLLVDGFWGAGTCAALMELAGPRLTRSRVASGNETPSRTSWSHFFVRDAADAPLIRGAEASIEALFASRAVLGGRRALAKTEALQVVKYHEGEFYEQHYDNRAGGPLTRAATIIVYLQDTVEGGATFFPRAVLSRDYDPTTSNTRCGDSDHAAAGAPAGPSDAAAAAGGAKRRGGGGRGGGGGSVGGSSVGGAPLPPGVTVSEDGEAGIRIHPRRGRAIIFWSRRPDGSEDVNSIHAAEVVRGGDKWIATRWMRHADE